MKSNLEKWLPLALTVLSMLAGFYYQGISAERRTTTLEIKLETQAQLTSELRGQISNIQQGIIEIAVEERSHKH